ncbi:MAG: hypothetical protein LLG04_17500 [Parachlamydia sp.]|nr:hypothetical protein [Parachlamydia sp.]
MSSNGGPVIFERPMIFSASLPHYSVARVPSPRPATPSPTPSSLSMRDRLIENINLLRDMHLALYQEISERRYRAEREFNRTQVISAPPPSPQKDEIQGPLQRFYQEKVLRIPELPAKLENIHMNAIARLTKDLDEKITQTEREFASQAELRRNALEAGIRRDFPGYITEASRTAIAAYREDLDQFEREIPEKITACRERVSDIDVLVGSNYS